MAKFDYARPLATANRLIDRYGAAGAIRRSGASTGDPWNPTVAAGTDYPCVAVVTDYSLRERESSLIEQGDRSALIAVGTLAIVPRAGDQLVLAGEVHDLIDLKPLNPGGVTLLYTGQARVA